jgi:hypothetical protein
MQGFRRIFMGRTCGPTSVLTSAVVRTYASGGGRRREHAELAQQAERIHDDASVLDTPILQTVDDNSPDANGASCGGNTEKLTPMSAGPFEAAGDFVVFRDLFLDREDNIGKTGAHGAKDVFQAVESWTLPRQWNLLDHVFPDILRCRFEWTGTHRGEFLGIPATGRTVRVWGIVIDRLKDGRIKDTRIIMDTFGLLGQLGVLPSPATP